MAQLGQQVDTRQPLAMIHANSEAAWQQAAQEVRAAIVLSDKAPESTSVVYRRIGGNA